MFIIADFNRLQIKISEDFDDILPKKDFRNIVSFTNIFAKNHKISLKFIKNNEKPV